MNENPSKIDEELQEKLEKLRQAYRAENPNPSPPPTPLPMELQSEIKIATDLLKIINKSENQNSIIFSPSAISGALNSMIKDVDEEAKKEIEMLLGKDLIDSSLGQSDSKEFKSIDFHDKEKASQEINDIISTDTNKKISNLIKTSDITQDVSCCLANAASFERQFEVAFNQRKKALFYSNPPRTIDYLHQKAGVCWNYSSGEDWTCLGIPYKQLDRLLFILLPNERNGLVNLIQKFDYSMIQQCMHGFDCEAKATIPAFEIESKIILNEHLKEMGITRIFEDENCLSRAFSDEGPHGLNMAVHSSKIQVDVYGTFSQRFPFIDYRNMLGVINVVFEADHPFIFFIVDYEFQKFKSLHFVGTFS